MKLWMLSAALIVFTVLSLFVGVSAVRPQDLLIGDEQSWQILMNSRIPRTISILIAGMGMGIIGLIMQQLTRNKFVSPTTAGTMDAARLGILVSMLLFAAASPLIRMSVAFLFALAGTFVFMKILDRIKFKDPVFVPLVGLMFGNILGSITTFFAYKHDLIQNMSSWLQGNFALVIKGRYEMLYISIPVLLIAYLYANKFTVAGMGESFSVNLGLNYRQVVNIGLIVAALVTAVVLLTVGMIPFLGLIIPNLVSMYNGDHLKKNLPHTAMMGAVFVLACDVVGRVIIYPYEIPIGLTVGVIGSAVFLYMLLRSKRYAH